MQCMDAPDWDALYAGDETPWDMGRPSPPLEHLLHERALPDGRVLVPGCGRGWEVELLARAGHEAVGLDLSPLAIEQARRRIGPLPGATLLAADFFAEPDKLAPHSFDWVFDQTFYCALPPDRCRAYARVAHDLVRPGGQWLILAFRTPHADRAPWDSPARRVIADACAADFELLELRPLRVESHPARRGRETLVRLRAV